jgi:hypothetical protein
MRAIWLLVRNNKEITKQFGYEENIDAFVAAPHCGSG